MVQANMNSTMLFTQSMPVQSFEDQKEQERKKVEFIMQSKNTETQQKINLIKDRLEAIEGNSSIKGIKVMHLGLYHR